MRDGGWLRVRGRRGRWTCGPCRCPRPDTPRAARPAPSESPASPRWHAGEGRGWGGGAGDDVRGEGIEGAWARGWGLVAEWRARGPGMRRG